jgi:hypothetical protein
MNRSNAMNALSRYDNSTYICSPCGGKECAESMRAAKMPNPKRLPHYCYYHNYAREKETVMISFGMDGYYSLDKSLRTIDYKELNANIGVTEEQAELMLMGSMWGWDCPGLQEGF